MRIRSRVLAAMGATLAVGSAVLLVVLHDVAAASLDRMERDAVRDDLARAKGILLERLDVLDGQAHDYAEWDDTWEFVRGEREDYVGTGLTTATMKNPGLAAAAVAAADGSIRWSASYDADADEFAAPPPFLAGPSLPEGLRAHEGTRARDVSGLWADGEDVYLVAALPVSRSDGSAGPAGTMLFARRADAAQATAIGELARLDVTFDRASASEAYEDEIHVAEDGGRIAGSTTTPVLGSDCPLRIRVSRTRAAMVEQRRVLRAAYAGMGLLAALLAGTALVLVDRLVLAPLERLRAGADDVAARALAPATGGATAAALPETGPEEFVALARHLNAMVSTLERSRADLAAAVERAEGASRAKSAFLAGMSHEIRTPMTGVLGMIDLALQDDVPADVRDLLLTARSSAHALLALLNDILDFSKVEAGRLELESVPFALRDCVADAARAFRAPVRTKGLRLDVEVSPGVPPRVLGDPLRLRQVLMNLVGNAVKFTEAGTIRVAAAPAPAAGHGIDFEVSDTGVGIPPERLESVFEEFAQAGAATARRYGGTGLGLAISSRLVGLMGGQLAVESPPGKGCTFRFRIDLPAAPEPRARTPVPVRLATPAAAAEGVRPLKVLLAEDDPATRRVARVALTRAGHHVTAVEDGRAALEAFTAGGYDVLLSDVQMPGMDGHALAREVRRREEGTGARLPIVAMSASAMSGDREACVDAGMDLWIAKPFSPAALVELVEQAGDSTRSG